MSSPVTGSDFIVASAGESLCTRLTRLLSLSAKLKTWFDWAFTSGGDAQNSLKAMFLPPPGTMMPYYSTQASATVKADVEGWYKDAGDTGIPYWRICDGTNGTPDLRGRVIVGVGQGSGLTDRAPASNFGSETHTLTSAETPIRQHFHGFGSRSNPAEGEGSGIGGDDGMFVQRSWTGTQSFPFHAVHGDGNSSDSGNLTSGDLGTTNAIDSEVTATNASSSHNNVQPSIALYYIIRTARLA